MFRAFTELLRLLAQWWGPRGFRIDELVFPASPGADYRVVLHAPDGTRCEHVGTLLEAVPPTRLVYTWRWTDGPLGPGDTLVELAFVAERGGVTVDLCHSRFANQAECDRHQRWPDSFERLDDWLRLNSRSTRTAP